MPIQITTVSTRPNADVPFWKFDVETREHLKSEYKDTNKIVSRTVELSADSLSRTVVRTFANRAAFDEFKADQARIAAIQERDAYNLANGITVTVTANFSN